MIPSSFDILFSFACFDYISKIEEKQYKNENNEQMKIKPKNVTKP